jgi:hypothetical protein
MSNQPQWNRGFEDPYKNQEYLKSIRDRFDLSNTTNEELVRSLNENTNNHITTTDDLMMNKIEEKDETKEIRIKIEDILKGSNITESIKNKSHIDFFLDDLQYIVWKYTTWRVVISFDNSFWELLKSINISEDKISQLEWFKSVWENIRTDERISLSKSFYLIQKKIA